MRLLRTPCGLFVQGRGGGLGFIYLVTPTPHPTQHAFLAPLHANSYPNALTQGKKYDARNASTLGTAAVVPRHSCRRSTSRPSLYTKDPSTCASRARLCTKSTKHVTKGTKQRGPMGSTNALDTAYEQRDTRTRRPVNNTARTTDVTHSSCTSCPKLYNASRYLRTHIWMTRLLPVICE